MLAARHFFRKFIKKRMCLSRIYFIYKEFAMLEELKMPIASLKEDIMNVWGRL